MGDLYGLLRRSMISGLGGRIRELRSSTMNIAKPVIFAETRIYGRLGVLKMLRWHDRTGWHRPRFELLLTFAHYTMGAWSIFGDEFLRDI